MNKELVECLKDIVIALLVIVIVYCLIKYMFILWGGRNLDSMKVEIKKGYFVEMPKDQINEKNKKAIKETIFKDGRDWLIKKFYGWLKSEKKYKFIKKGNDYVLVETKEPLSYKLHRGGDGNITSVMKYITIDKTEKWLENIEHDRIQTVDSNKLLTKDKLDLRTFTGNIDVETQDFFNIRLVKWDQPFLWKGNGNSIAQKNWIGNIDEMNKQLGVFFEKHNGVHLWGNIYKNATVKVLLGRIVGKRLYYIHYKVPYGYILINTPDNKHVYHNDWYSKGNILLGDLLQPIADSKIYWVKEF
jgi:hypothetical protein